MKIKISAHCFYNYENKFYSMAKRIVFFIPSKNIYCSYISEFSGMQSRLLSQGLTSVSLSLLVLIIMCSFLNGVLTPLLIPKFSLCLTIFIRLVKTSWFPPGVNIIQGPLFSGAHSQTPYPKLQVGGLFVQKKMSYLKVQGIQVIPTHNSKATHYQGFPSNTFPHLHPSYLQ